MEQPIIMSPASYAVVYERHGPPDNVTRLIQHSPVQVMERDVCVQMLAAPINPSDINKIEGVYPLKPKVPAVGGSEGVGKVLLVGSAVTDLKPGDFVIPSPLSFGTWETYIVKGESAWRKINLGDLPVEYAATVSINPLTALILLQDFATLHQGDYIVQNGATSMVGQCIIQLASLRGIRTINIIRDRVGSDKVKEKLKQLGADKVFTESQLKANNIKDFLITLPKSKLGFNCVGDNAASLVLKLLRHGGTMVTYGGMSKKPITVSTSSFIFKDLCLKGFWLHNWMASDKAVDCRKMVDYLLMLAQEGKLKYEMDLVPFNNFQTALDKALGKLGSQPKQVIIF